MYIITNRNTIFNTDCIQEIRLSSNIVYAVGGGTSSPISYDPDALATIADGIRNHADFVEVS